LRGEPRFWPEIESFPKRQSLHSAGHTAPFIYIGVHLQRAATLG
jgi:hypothetical protein